MGEGLLKERILEHFINWTMGKTALDYRRNEVTKILSEAAKEFPDYYELQQKYEWDTPSEFSEAVKKWFKKWFGEQ